MLNKMPGSDQACPDPQQLTDFVLGRLEDQQLVATLDHVEQCPPCGDTIRGLKVSDTIQEMARHGLAALDHESSADAPGDDNQLVMGLIQDNLDREALLARSRHTMPAASTLSSRAAEVLQLLEPLPAAAPDAPPALGQIDGYRVVELIGAGATGVVFRAIDQDLNREVVLKVLRPSLGPDARERFMAEARATAALDHENIITIYQVGVADQLAYIAMQWLPGQTLESILLREPEQENTGVGNTANAITVEQALSIGRQIARGLAAAHAKGLMHRDIKPANIWIDQSGDRLKLLDFGLVRAMDDDPAMTETGMIAGTPSYMSPEQSRGQELDTRTDLFSLGSLLYECVTGRPPYRATNVLGTLHAIQNNQPPAPHELNDSIPRDFSWLIMALLDKDRDRRPSTATAVANAIGKPMHEWSFQWTPNADQSPAANRRPKINTAAEGRNIGTRTWLVALALLPLLALAAFFAGPQIIRIATDKGVLEIRTSDPDLKVQVEQNGELVQVIDLKTQQTIEIKSGEYSIVPVSDENGIRVSADKVIMSRGGHQIVEISRLAPDDTTGNPIADSGQLETQKYRLGHARISSVATRTAIKFPELQITYGVGGVITARGTPAELNRLWNYVDELDKADPNQVTAVDPAAVDNRVGETFRLRHIQVADIAARLAYEFPELSINFERANQLTALATPSELERLRQYLETLDKPDFAATDLDPTQPANSSYTEQSDVDPAELESPKLSSIRQFGSRETNAKGNCVVALKNLSPAAAIAKMQSVFPELQATVYETNSLLITGPSFYLDNAQQYLKQIDGTASPATRQGQPASRQHPAANQPMWDGKTRDELLRIIKHEKEPSRLKSAWRGLYELDSTAEEFAETWNRIQPVIEKNGNASNTLEIFLRIDPDQAVQYLLRQIQEGSTEGVKFAVMALKRLRYLSKDHPFNTRLSNAKEQFLDGVLFRWSGVQDENHASEPSLAARQLLATVISSASLQPEFRPELFVPLSFMITARSSEFEDRVLVIQYVSEKQPELLDWTNSLSPKNPSDYFSAVELLEYLGQKLPSRIPEWLPLIEKLTVARRMEGELPFPNRRGVCFSNYDIRVLRLIDSTKWDADQSSNLLDHFVRSLAIKDANTTEIQKLIPAEVTEKVPQMQDAVAAQKLYQAVCAKLWRQSSYMAERQSAAGRAETQ